jgi:hypothetical protein
VKLAQEIRRSFARELGKCAARAVTLTAGGAILLIADVALRRLG